MSRHTHSEATLARSEAELLTALRTATLPLGRAEVIRLVADKIITPQEREAGRTLAESQYHVALARLVERGEVTVAAGEVSTSFRQQDGREVHRKSPGRVYWLASSA